MDAIFNAISYSNGQLNANGVTLQVALTYTWAQLQALASPSVGDRAFVSDYGNSEFVYDGAFWARNSPIQLLGSGMPFVMQSSCTVGAATNSTSAITGLTTFAGLGASYPIPCWMYFAGASATSAGLTSGSWYYASITAATTATLYNNIYSGGSTVAPTSPANFTSLAGGAYTQYTAGAVKGPYVTLPSNMLGKNGAIKYNGLWCGYSVGGANPLLYMGLGSSASNVFASAGGLTGTSATVVCHERILRNRDNQAKQVVFNASSSSSFGANGNTGNSYLAIATTSDQSVSIGLQTQTATNWIILDAYNIECVPS
jgi:hypothetical protein